MIQNKLITLICMSFLYFPSLNAISYLYNKETGNIRILMEYTDNIAPIKNVIKKMPTAQYYYALSTNQLDDSISTLKDILPIKSYQTTNRLLHCLVNDSCNDQISMSDLYENLLTFLGIVEVFEVLITDALLVNLKTLKEKFLSDFSILRNYIIQGLVSEDLVKLIQQSENNPLIISSLQTKLKKALKLPCAELKKKITGNSLKQLITVFQNKLFAVELIYMQILWATEQKGASNQIILVIDPQWIDGFKKIYSDFGYKEYDRGEIAALTEKYTQVL